MILNRMKQYIEHDGIKRAFVIKQVERRSFQEIDKAEESDSNNECPSLIKDELKSKFKTNVVKQKRFSEMLTASLNKYSNRAIEAAQVIEELIAMARRFREDLENGIALGLDSSEQSFYDALARVRPHFI